MIWALLGACLSMNPRPAASADEVDTAISPGLPEPLPLPPALLLRRASLDLRGVTPSLDELALVEADPAALPGLLRTFLDDPRYEGRLVDLFSEHLLTRTDNYLVGPEDYGLDSATRPAFVRAVGEEAPRILAFVGAHDRPWSEILTADYSFAPELLVGHWPIDYPAGATGWQPVHYTDGRPPLGVLSTNGLWWRYYTTASGFNRSRAEAISRLFLCESYLERPIRFEAASLVSSDDLAAATRTVESCVSCHSTLDPLAANLFGFWAYDIYDPFETSIYHTEREELGAYYLDVEPGLSGTPLDAPVDLGPALAADPRFARCAVSTMAGLLWRRPVDPVADFDRISALEVDFEQGGQTLRPLVLSILAGAEYQAGALPAEADPAQVERTTTRRLLSPEALADAIEALTTFRWTEEGFDQLTNDERGYRVLAGGVDGDGVTRPATEATLTQALVMMRLAEAAAATALAHDAPLPAEERLLFGPGDLSTLGPGEADFEANIAVLHRRLFSLDPTDAQREADAALWTEVAAQSSPALAWTALATALLRDPAFWTD